MHVEFAHARHVVAVSTRRMCGNKIDFSPVEDELRERRRLKRQRKYSRTPEELVEGYLKITEQTRKTVTTSNPF